MEESGSEIRKIEDLSSGSRKIEVSVLENRQIEQSECRKIEDLSSENRIIEDLG